MEKPVVLFFGGLNFGHTLSGRTETLARIFAKKGFFVIFIEMPCSIIGFLKNVNRTKKNFILSAFPSIRIEDGIIIIERFPIMPFGRFKFVRTVNKFIVSLRLKMYLRRLQNIKIIGIVGNPWWYQVIKYLNLTKVYYDCIDDVTVLCPPKDVKLYKEWEVELVKISHSIFAISELLQKNMLSIAPQKPVIFLQNGVNAKWFKNQVENSNIPEDIISIKKPIIGYIGALSSWVDIELIAYSAKQLQNWTFVLVGPTLLPKIDKGLKGISNIYLLGPRPYKWIPSYINAFDVCLIPFKLDMMANPSDPVKLYEYLALGKPVVSTNIAVMKKLNEQSLVYIGKNKEDFVCKIKEAYENKHLHINERCLYANQNSWEARVNKLLELKLFDLK